METVELTKPKRKRATIYEVARLAKVSHVTVTRAFCNEASVSGDTRKKVLAAAKELQYRPNPLAKGLNGALTQTMAIVWPMGYTFISESAVGELVIRLQSKNYQIQLANTLNEPGMVKNVLDDLHHRAVDAVVLNITPETFDKEVEEQLKRFKAAVVTTVHPVNVAVDQIIWNRTTAIEAAVDHLVKIGRRRIGYTCFTVKKDESGRVVRLEQYKADAFVNRLREHGVSDPEAGLVDAETWLDWDDIDGYRTFLSERLFSGKFPFDGVLCNNDEWAAILMGILRKHGLRVPEDVAVVGYNDSRAAKLCEPPLASVNRRNEDVVRAIEELVFARLNNSDIAIQKREVPMQFLWRESAGK